MSRTLLNFWLDVVLLLLFSSLLWCIFVIRFVFPPGTAASGWSLWGWTYDQWFDFQFGCACAMALAVLVHVMLHWTWVCGVITSRLLPKRETKRLWGDGERTLVGVGLLVVLFNLLGLAFAVATLSVQAPT